MKQSAPLEILVLDDGSDDGTSGMVCDEFSTVRLKRFDSSAGYIARRNQGAHLAAAPIIISIDDDAVFPGSETIAETIAEFDDPRIGAVAIPFVNVNQSPAVSLPAPAEGRFATFSFTGTAYAMRRDIFMRLHGFRACLMHQGEEMDFCIRLLEAGCVVRVGRADPIHHLESPRRDLRRMDHFGRRNDILFAWNNVPLAALLPHLLVTSCNGLLVGLRVGRFRGMARGLLSGYAALFRDCAHRQPVSWRTYRVARELKKQIAMPMERVIEQLAR